MRYPPPPWRLNGPCSTVTGLMAVSVARPMVPADLDIIEVRPGLTVASILIADYQDRATFPYSELAVMPAIVRYRRVRGPWISSIWVNSTPSLQGGREMWGLHKEHADFAWSFGARTSVTVTDAHGDVGTWSWSPPRRRVPFPARFSGVGSVNGDRRRYRGQGVARLWRTPVELTPGADDAVAAVAAALQHPVSMAGALDLRFTDIRILAPAP